MADSKSYTIWDGATPVAVTSSTDATPIVVTATSHGFSTGDLVLIQGHATNVAANGVHRVTRITANTFSLQNRNTTANVAGSGAGAGSGGLVVVAPKILFASDFRNIILSVVTAGTATMTVKIAGSTGLVLADATTHGDTPNIGATLSATNPYSFLQIIDLDASSSVDGATGIVVAGTDINKTYEINTNSIKYVMPVITSWSAGNITMKASLFDNM